MMKGEGVMGFKNIRTVEIMGTVVGCGACNASEANTHLIQKVWEGRHKNTPVK